MSDVVIVALITLFGTLFSGIMSVVISNKLVNYRIEQLEKKVDKHNNLVERTYKLEEKVALLTNDIEHLEE